MLIHTTLYAQVRAVVNDYQSGEPLPYVNIWVKDKMSGTTSEKDGTFYIDRCLDNDILVFSAVGYEMLEIKREEINEIVPLKRLYRTLDEVEVIAKQPEVIGSFVRTKKSKSSCLLLTSNTPWMAAKVFPYGGLNTETLNGLRVYTRSEKDSVLFHVRLYATNSDNFPGEPLLDYPIRMMTSTGNGYVEANLSTYNIPFPKQGLTVVLEWLIIEQNKIIKEVFFNVKDKSGVMTEFYQPGFLMEKNDGQTRLYLFGKWGKVTESPFDRLFALSRCDSKHNSLKIEIF
jgi:hypothetical protein